RARAQAVLAQTLPQLPDSAFAATKRQVPKPAMLHDRDHGPRQLQELPYPEEVKRAAVRAEGLRRRPEVWQGAGTPAAALRGVLLGCAVVRPQAGAVGQAAVAAVRDLFGRAYRPRSLVECIKSVLRMQQARHRKLRHGLLDRKRLCGNWHRFRTGRRRGPTPYQVVGLAWLAGLR